MEKQPSPGGDEDEKVRTSPHVWRHERAVTGQTVSIIFEEVWNERPTAKGGLNGQKWKPFAEGIAKALIEAIVL